MIKKFLSLFVILSLITGCSNYVNYINIQQREYKNDELIVKLDKNTNLNQLNIKFKIKQSLKLSNNNIYKIKFENIDFNTAFKFFKNSKYVEFVEPNYIYHLNDYIKNDKVLELIDKSLSVNKFKITSITGYTPNDPYYSYQWYIKLVNIDKAWELTKGNKNIKVAVIDSGVDPNHPDLKDNLLPLKDIWTEEQGADIYNDGTQIYNYSGKDGHGHGTHVCGILGAVMDNGQGIAGVAGGGIKILPIKSTDYKGDTLASTLTQAISYAIDQKVNIINISIGGPLEQGTQSLKDVVNNAIANGITIVSATGNESDRAAKRIEAITIPAAYKGVIAVSAINQFKRVANYSNSGPETTITAPGGGGDKIGEGSKIYSTWPTYITYNKKNGPYNYLSGTSMAAPIVTGVVALLLSLEPSLTPYQIKNRLSVCANDIENYGFDESSGYGIIDAYNTLAWKSHDGKSN